MLKVKSFTFNPFAENTFVVSDESGACVIIDPGCYDVSERVELDNYISNQGLKLELILNTHCHIDHITGNYYLHNKYKVPLMYPEKDEYNLTGAVSYAAIWGFKIDASPKADKYIEPGTDIVWGKGTRFQVIFTPGHSAGHVSFFHKEDKLLFSGDVLFQGSIGRTDLPGGNHQTLMEVIRDEILPLGDEVKVFPGHMGITTIGQERKSNPFILDFV